MRIFLTGSTGFIGSVIVSELVTAGHRVLGLTRSDESVRRLRLAGAEPRRGDIEDLDSLRRGAADCDGVIHTAFDHNFAHFVANCEKDRRAITALADGLEGSDRPLVITSSTAMGAATPGQPAVEDFFNPAHSNPRVASELAGVDAAARGVNVSVVRLSQIHNTVKQGLVTEVVELARKKGVSAYIGEGSNRWSATHVNDTGAAVQACVGKTHRQRPDTTPRPEEGIGFRHIAEAVGRRVGVPAVALSPEEAAAHFGWLSAFVTKDMSAVSTLTQSRLQWHPTGPGLIADLEQQPVEPDR